MSEEKNELILAQDKAQDEIVNILMELDEEKQAIEFLKHSIFEYEEIDTSVMEYIDKNHKTIYKLILKQQKEIERLKKFEKYYENEKVVWQRKDYISKDKIIEKIKKLETSDILGDYIAIHYLKELLGETND